MLAQFVQGNNYNWKILVAPFIEIERKGKMIWIQIDVCVLPTLVAWPSCETPLLVGNFEIGNLISCQPQWMPCPPWHQTINFRGVFYETSTLRNKFCDLKTLPRSIMSTKLLYDWDILGSPIYIVDILRIDDLRIDDQSSILRSSIYRVFNYKGANELYFWLGPSINSFHICEIQTKKKVNRIKQLMKKVPFERGWGPNGIGKEKFWQKKLRIS